jgi:hypothetical protein
LNIENPDEPVKMKAASDPESGLTKLILYLYSMQTFLYSEINRASRDKDKSKIKTLGPFSFVLSWIV